MIVKTVSVVVLTAGMTFGGFFPFAQGGGKTDEGVGQIVYVPTPEVVVMKMLKMAKTNSKDVVFDLGCGDGRIVALAATKFGAKGVGIDIDPERIKDSHATLKKYKVPKGMVQIRQGNALNPKDLPRATVVTLYMLPEFMNRLEPIAKKRLKPGTRIVSHDFTFPNWRPDWIVEFRGPEREHTLYMWTVPAAKGK